MSFPGQGTKANRENFRENNKCSFSFLFYKTLNEEVTHHVGAPPRQALHRCAPLHNLSGIVQLIDKEKLNAFCWRYSPSDEQLVLADGEHPEEVEEDEEVRASRLAMPLLQWLADQHHRKHHVPGTTTGTTAAATSSVPAFGGDAGAVSRLVASALVRDWSALSLPALAALVRVLTTECASFLPAHAVRTAYFYLFIYS